MVTVDQAGLYIRPPESFSHIIPLYSFADSYWVMFDYDRGYADDLEASGLMSLERIAKPAYFFSQPAGC